MSERRRAIKADADPLAWAKAVCATHAKTPLQTDAATNVRDAAVVFISVILQNCKASSDRTTAVRLAREALMFAREAINLEWEDL